MKVFPTRILKPVKIATLLLLMAHLAVGQKNINMVNVMSPDKNITVVCDPGKLTYTISYKNKPVLDHSKLGLSRDDVNFSRDLTVTKISKVKTVTDKYTILTAKRKNVEYQANEVVVETKSTEGKRMNIVFRVSNDGVAFRYEFPEKSEVVRKIISDETTFHFFKETNAWLQPKADAQTGWEHTNPSYESHYKMSVPVGSPSPTNNGWVYPALFKYNDVWLLITEAALGRQYCGTALHQGAIEGEYKIGFPQAPEVYTGGALNPEATLPWKTPWRIIAVGELKTIMESTLGTDLALPAVNIDQSFIKPGKSAWSWIMKKDDSTVYKVQKKYVDFAADMKWQYCLLDATWDRLMGYDSVKLLADYARERNVGLLLWYNSAGDWNTVKYTPKDKLLTHDARMKEFARLQSMGIKGVKIDFFSGDGQSMMNYYQDILEDAAANKLLVNFHGTTLPRGLHRTYPNLMTAEAVYGFEMITFMQEAANVEPEHAVMSAMVRNVFDPMDFTPMNLYQVPRINRVTTASFELATSVIFLSGIQHYAESPEGMDYVPSFAKDFLRNLPNSWDDMKFIDGYPGKLFVVARKAGNKWYVAGINGENIEKNLSLDLSSITANSRNVQLVSSDNTAADDLLLKRSAPDLSSGKLNITLKGNDGFVLLLE